jgi:exopolysaccharide production protein ExoZ
MKRYEYLDSLRGIAIIGVVMTHVGQTVPDAPEMLVSFARFGLRGVQLFFMVSALTLCLVTKPETLVPARFYIRRYFRVAPMFYLSGIFYLLYAAVGGVSFAPNTVYPIDVLSTLFFVHGLNPHGINNVVPGGWSIASEAIFYAAFPFIIAYANGPLKWLGLSCVALGFAFINSALPRLLSLHDPMWKDFFHFNFISNLPAFCAGIFIFTVLKSYDAPFSRPLKVASILFVIAACIAIGCMSSRIQGDQLLMVPILGLLVFVAATSAPWIFVNRPLSFLGEISFSVYLVHFVVLHALGNLHRTGLSPVIRIVLLYFMTLAISSLVAWLCYRLIERPMAKVGHRLSDRIGALRRDGSAAPLPKQV